jgi:hypothetical protein
VIVYNDGSPATVLPINLGNLQLYWRLWLERLKLFKSQSEFGDPANVETVQV